jgi:hypothetical protein
VAGEVLVKSEGDLITTGRKKIQIKEKRLTRGLVKRIRNDGKDAEEGKYFEKELSSLERSYSPTTQEDGDG